MIKTIKDFNLAKKRVIIRCDFNVPVKDGIITDDNRIKKSINTIRYAISNHAKVIIISHLGRVKDEESKKKLTLEPIAKRLSELLDKEVTFVTDNKGEEVEKTIASMKARDILLLENTRNKDFPEKLESKNDQDLAKYWASLGDIFINDAFGTAHRSHASNVGISTYLPSGVGFLIEKELDALKLLDEPNRPFTVILGGSKVSDKIKLIENLLPKVDYILIGGGMANTFVKAMGHSVGKSLVDNDSLEFCKNILKDNSDKIIIPVDFNGSKEISNDSKVEYFEHDQMPDDFIALDIGHKTIKNFNKILENSETIVWNGPVGMFELENYATGTYSLGEKLSEIDKKIIIGGGDTASALINMGFEESFTHISTGGGATIEYLEGEELPALKALNK